MFSINSVGMLWLFVLLSLCYRSDSQAPRAVETTLLLSICCHNSEHLCLSGPKTIPSTKLDILHPSMTLGMRITAATATTTVTHKSEASTSKPSTLNPIILLKASN